MNYYIFAFFVSFLSVLVIDEYYCAKLQYEIELFEAMKELKSGKKRDGLFVRLKRWLKSTNFKVNE